LQGAPFAGPFVVVVGRRARVLVLVPLELLLGNTVGIALGPYMPSSRRDISTYHSDYKRRLLGDWGGRSIVPERALELDRLG
jgi:hypothetical protein